MTKFVDKIKNIEKERDESEWCNDILNKKYKLIPYSFKDRMIKEKEHIKNYSLLKRLTYRKYTMGYVLNFPSHYEYSRYGDFLGENTRFHANISIRHRVRVQFEKMILRKIFNEKTNTDFEWFTNYMYKFIIGFGNIEYEFYFKNYKFVEQ